MNYPGRGHSVHHSWSYEAVRNIRQHVTSMKLLWHNRSDVLHWACPSAFWDCVHCEGHEWAGRVLGFDHNASSSEKVFWSESGEKSAQMPKQSKTTLNKHVAGFWCERQQQMLFFTGGSIIMDYGLNVFELKLSWWICFSFVFSRC